MKYSFFRPFLALILALTFLLPGCPAVRAEEAPSGEDFSISEVQEESSAEESTAPETPTESEPAEVPEESIPEPEAPDAEEPAPLPEAPALGSASNKKPGIYLTWSSVENASVYQVLRKDAPDGDWSVIAETTSCSYTDTAVASGTDCRYTVCGLNADGAAGPYDETGLVISRVAEPVISTSICDTGTLVSWDPVPGAARYYVYRKLPSESWTRMATVKKGTSWTDTQVENGDAYLYTVKARRTVDGIYYNSSHSSGASSLYLAPPEGTTGSRTGFTSIKISWQKNPWATGYEVQYATDDAFSKDLQSVLISDPDTLTTAIEGLTKGKIYSVRVRTRGSLQGTEVWSSWSPVLSVDTLLNLTVTGLSKSIVRKASSTIKDTILVKNAAAGKLKLQYYDAASKKWVTKTTYELTGGAKQKITIQYPGDWKKRINTKWRLYIPKTSGSRSYTSSTVKITAQNVKTLSLASPSAVIVRGSDGKVLYNKNAYQAQEMASTTKMMTALLTLENVKLTAKVTYTKEADNTGWGCLYPEVGSKFYCKDLLHALMIESSNDAATALAQHISGSVSKFAKKMTKRAAELGCKDTNYNNPHGLHGKTHHSTAYDLCLIQRACYAHKTYRSIIKKKKYTFSTVDGNYTHTAYTSDDLLYEDISGFKGGKTGWIEEAGCCFSGVFEYKGETYYFTVLGSEFSDPRWKDCRKLMSYIKKYA